MEHIGCSAPLEVWQKMSRKTVEELVEEAWPGGAFRLKLQCFVGGRKALRKLKERSSKRKVKTFKGFILEVTWRKQFWRTDSNWGVVFLHPCLVFSSFALIILFASLQVETEQDFSSKSSSQARELGLGPFGSFCFEENGCWRCGFWCFLIAWSGESWLFVDIMILMLLCNGLVWGRKWLNGWFGIASWIHFFKGVLRVPWQYANKSRLLDFLCLWCCFHVCCVTVWPLFWIAWVSFGLGLHFFC